MANETIVVNSTLDDLPAIAEDYTATGVEIASKSAMLSKL